MTTPPPEVRAALQKIVEQEVAKAHADLLQELAAKEVEIQQAKAQIEQLLDALAVATLEMNDLRGIPRPQYDENGVVR